MKKREVLIILLLLALIVITLELSPGFKTITNKAAAPFIPTTETDTDETRIIKELKVPTKEEKFSLIKKGEEVIIDLGPSSPFLKIRFKAKEDLINIIIKIEEVTIKSEEKVYKSIKISHDNDLDSKIEKVVLEIQVPNQWMKLNNLKSSQIEVKRYINNGQELPTTKLREDKELTYYSVTSPGLSIFSIIGIDKEEKSAAETLSSIIELSKERPITTSIIISIVLVLGLALLFYLKTRPKKRLIKKKRNKDI